MTWTTLHGASPIVSPKIESFKISTASRPRLSRRVQECGQHQFFNSTVTQALFKTSVMVVGYNFPIWSKMMSFDFPWNANENYENSVLCISSLPWTPQTLLPATSYQLQSHTYSFQTNAIRILQPWNQHLFQPKMLPLGEKIWSEHMRQLRLMPRWTFATHGQNGLPEINRVLL